MNSLVPAEFVRVLTARRGHCRALLELSRNQRGLISSDNFELLLELLGQKQQILVRLDELNREFPDLRRQWQRLRDSLDANVRQECEQLLLETENLLAELVLEEQESTAVLSARRDATRQELLGIADSSRARNAYNDSLSLSPSHLLDIGQ